MNKLLGALVRWYQRYSAPWINDAQKKGVAVKSLARYAWFFVVLAVVSFALGQVFPALSAPQNQHWPTASSKWEFVLEFALWFVIPLLSILVAVVLTLVAFARRHRGTNKGA